MKKERKQRKFDWQKGRWLTTMRRLALNDLIPVAIRITDNKVADGLIADANRRRK